MVLRKQFILYAPFMLFKTSKYMNFTRIYSKTHMHMVHQTPHWEWDRTFSFLTNWLIMTSFASLCYWFFVFHTTHSSLSTGGFSLLFLVISFHCIYITRIVGNNNNNNIGCISFNEITFKTISCVSDAYVFVVYFRLLYRLDVVYYCKYMHK